MNIVIESRSMFLMFTFWFTVYARHTVPHVLLFPQIQVYLNTYFESCQSSLISLLLVSANPIIDPWVFIILSPPVPRLLWDKLCRTAKFKRTQENVRSIHPALNHSNPPVDSEVGSLMKVYTGIPGTAGSWFLKPLFVCGNHCGVVAHSCIRNNKDRRSRWITEQMDLKPEDEKKGGVTPIISWSIYKSILL